MSLPELATPPESNKLFGAMPVRQSRDWLFGSGSIVSLNLVTFFKPEGISKKNRVQTVGLWQQGLSIKVETADIPARFCRMPWSDYNPTPAHRLIEGVVLNHDSGVPVKGLVHPELPGWLEVEDKKLSAQNPNTIADLKAAIGQIGLGEAFTQYGIWQTTGAFLVSGQYLK